MALALNASDVPPSQAFDVALNAIVYGQRFDLPAWEVTALAEKAGARLRYPRPEHAGAAGARYVQDYLDLATHASELKGQTDDAYARLPAGAQPGAELLSQEGELAATRARQRGMQLEVESIIEDQVASVLKGEGVTTAGIVFPPVLFRFYPLPLHLIISPRDHIGLLESDDLRADLSLSQREQMETTLDSRLDISSLVEELGGYGAYPPLVMEDTSLTWLVSTVAHEWTHNYLTFHPLGWRYESEPQMTTINETAASIIGDEVGARVIAAFYPWVDPPELSWQRPRQADSAEQAPAAEAPEPEFSFDKFMRETRLEADRRLAAGDVGGAEEYMEARRQTLVEKGYYIRKLNQAYFAFHGLYATGPGSVDPIGPKMEELRRQSQTLQAFVHIVEAFKQPADLDQALRP